jgi:hypothetical protein
MISSEELKEKWETALSYWSKFTKLREPIWSVSPQEDKANELGDTFAMIKLDTHTVYVSLYHIYKLGLENSLLEILTHEIGHHVYCPGDLTDHGRTLARIRKVLKGFEHAAPLVSNLYSDLLINCKLQRDFGLNIAGVYQKIKSDEPDKLWMMYMRSYEILFALQRNTLIESVPFAETDNLSVEGDAQLVNRLIKNYARDWLDGAGYFAAICYPYFFYNQCQKTVQSMCSWNDMKCPASGDTFPSGLLDMDEGDVKNYEHPALSEVSEEKKDSIGDSTEKLDSAISARGQCREPFEVGEILKDMGLTFKKDELTIKYYKERAGKYLIPFPTIKQPTSKEPLAEGLDPWDLGSPIEDINWFETITKSPVVIPGFTTVETHYGLSEGSMPNIEPIDLDIYVDCSGSMPDPSHNISYLALAGAIISLSALRVGSKVQATLWSGPKQFHTTKGFIRDEKEILRIITGYIGGSTAFPIHILRDTYSNRKSNARKVHILQISDDGITTMFDKDEKKNSGWGISKKALEKANGGGTFVLNLWQDYKKDKQLVMAEEMGWDIHVVKAWEDLVEFAKKFSQKHYA